MKMVKKSLLGLVVAAMVLSLAGCGKVDDPEGAIKKKDNNNYYIDYNNTNTPTGNTEQDKSLNYRAYRSTLARHLGGLVKVTFNDTSTSGESKLGVIFGLEEKSGKRSFCIVGVSGTGNYYVSRFINVTDIRAYNFGAVAGATGDAPQEIEIVGLGSDSVSLTNGSIYICYKANTYGSFSWALLNETQAATYNKANGLIPDSTLKSGSISNAFTVPNNVTEATIPQKLPAVYAMIQPGTELDGTWQYIGTYKEAEDIEQID